MGFSKASCCTGLFYFALGIDAEWQQRSRAEGRQVLCVSTKARHGKTGQRQKKDKI